MTNEEYFTRLRSIIWSACGGVGAATLLINCIISFFAISMMVASVNEEIAKNKCKCNGESNINEARNIIIQNDPKAQAIRDILIKRGEIDDDMLRTSVGKERTTRIEGLQAGRKDLQRGSDH